jgi:hypothetical protein
MRDAGAGELAPGAVGGAVFEALGENGDRQGGRVGDEQVHVVGFAVELDQLDTELGAHVAHGGLGEGEYGVGEHRAPVLGYEHQVGVQQRHAVPGVVIGRGVSAHLYGCGVGEACRMAPTPVGEPVGKPRARKRAKGAPTHVRSWPLRPDAAQCREIGTRFFTGVRVYNAVLGEFIARSRAVKSDPAWQAARQLPRRNKGERAARRAAVDAVAAAHGFTAGAAQSFASSLRKSWVRDYLPAQETQNLGVRAFDAVNQRHLRRKGKGKPRFKSTRRGLHSLAAKDGLGALRPKADAAGRLVGLQWGAGFVIDIAVPAHSSGAVGSSRSSWPRSRR